VESKKDWKFPLTGRLDPPRDPGRAERELTEHLNRGGKNGKSGGASHLESPGRKGNHRSVPKVKKKKGRQGVFKQGVDNLRGRKKGRGMESSRNDGPEKGLKPCRSVTCVKLGRALYFGFEGRPYFRHHGMTGKP